MLLRKALASVLLGASALSVGSVVAAPHAFASDYHYCRSDHFNFFNPLKKAHGYGNLKEYNSFSCTIPGGVARVQFDSSSKVTDYGTHVKCIWVRVRAKTLTGSVSLPLGASVSGSSATDGWYGHCRGSDPKTSPAPFSLNGVGYASRTLYHVDLDIGSSSGPNDPISYSTRQF